MHASAIPLTEAAEIACQTGGSACLLRHADQLIHVVCENALEDIVGAELVAEYKARYN